MKERVDAEEISNKNNRAQVYVGEQGEKSGERGEGGRR